MDNSEDNGANAERMAPILWGGDLVVVVVSMEKGGSASERRGNDSKRFKDFCLTNGSSQGLDCRMCSKFALRQEQGGGEQLLGINVERFRGGLVF